MENYDICQEKFFKYGIFIDGKEKNRDKTVQIFRKSGSAR